MKGDGPDDGSCSRQKRLPPDCYQETESLLLNKPPLPSRPHPQLGPHGVAIFEDYVSTRPQDCFERRGACPVPGGFSTAGGGTGCGGGAGNGCGGSGSGSGGGVIGHSGTGVVFTGTTPHPKFSGNYNAPNDVSEMLKSIQCELDFLKESIRTSSKASDSCFYERIDEVHRTRSHSTTWREFFMQTAKDRGLYRLKNVFDSQISVCVRMLWIILFLASLTLLSYQLYDRVMLYLSFPSHTTINTAYVESLTFPLITVCNLNKYRLSETVDIGVYKPLYSILHHTRPLNQSDVFLQLDAANLTYADFLHRVAHKRDQLIYSCYWKGKPCSVSSFTEVYTDYGLCYMFSLDSASARVDKTGPLTGISLILNVEQYDYLLGPKSAVGVRIAVTEHPTEPMSESNSITIPVGKHTALEISKIQRDELPQPYGSCGKWWSFQAVETTSVTKYRCLQRCRKAFFKQRCRCVHPHLADYKQKAALRICTVADYFKCVVEKPGIRDFNLSSCGCPTTCRSTEYSLSASQAAISSYGAESSVRNFRNREALEGRYRHAMDTYHRVDSTIFEHDKRMLLRIPKELNESSAQINNFERYVKAYNRDNSELKSVLEAVKRLNESVQVHYEQFNLNTHVGFVYLLTHLSSKVKQIVEMRSERRMVTRDLQSYVKDITWNIGFLVDIRDKSRSSHPSAPLLPEIADGLKNFRRKIVHGHGQKYKEFRDDKEFFDTKTQILLNLTAGLSKRLIEESWKIKNISSKMPAIFVRKEFHRFFNVMSKSISLDVQHIAKEMETVSKRYRQHRDIITNFIKNLTDEGSQLAEGADKLKRGLNSFGESVTTFRETLANVQGALSKLGIEYFTLRYGKTILAKKMQNDHINGALINAQAALQKLVSDVQSLREEAAAYAEKLRPIAFRIADFQPDGNMRVDELRDVLSFKQLQVDVDSLVENMDDKLQMIRVYRDELREYNDAIKIDETFYRNNFLHVDVYFRELSETIIGQRESYDLLDLSCDIGGSMALYVGASLLTIFDLTELIEKSIRFYFTRGKR